MRINSNRSKIRSTSNNSFKQKNVSNNFNENTNIKVSLNPFVTFNMLLNKDEPFNRTYYSLLKKNKSNIRKLNKASKNNMRLDTFNTEQTKDFEEFNNNNVSKSNISTYNELNINIGNRNISVVNSKAFDLTNNNKLEEFLNKKNNLKEIPYYKKNVLLKSHKKK